MKIQEVNVETQEIIERDATEAELHRYKLQQEKNAKEAVEAKTKAEAKAALLERLGITEDEAKLLLA